MRRQFDQQLALLNRELIEMGALCEEVIALASKALTEGDPDMATRAAISGSPWTPRSTRRSAPSSPCA